MKLKIIFALLMLAVIPSFVAQDGKGEDPQEIEKIKQKIQEEKKRRLLEAIKRKEEEKQKAIEAKKISNFNDTKRLIETELKWAVVNFVYNTIEKKRVDMPDPVVKTVLTQMWKNNLASDIFKSQYKLQQEPCIDLDGKPARSSTQLGVMGAEVCFSYPAIVSPDVLNGEVNIDRMSLFWDLLGTVLHEHSHHYGYDEDLAYRLSEFGLSLRAGLITVFDYKDDGTPFELYCPIQDICDLLYSSELYEIPYQRVYRTRYLRSAAEEITTVQLTDNSPIVVRLKENNIDSYVAATVLNTSEEIVSERLDKKSKGLFEAELSAQSIQALSVRRSGLDCRKQGSSSFTLQLIQNGQVIFERTKTYKTHKDKYGDCIIDEKDYSTKYLLSFIKD